MLFEFIEAEFSRVQDKIPLDKATLVMQSCAAIHNEFWGAKFNGSTIDIAFINRADEGASLLIPKVAKAKSKVFFTGLVAKEANAAPDFVKKGLTELLNDVPLLLRLCQHGSDSSCLTVTHGDPRIDNWFFNETDSTGSITHPVGILDWQLMVKQGVHSDVSWFLCTTKDADDADTQAVIQVYYDELKRLRVEAGGEEIPSMEEFMQELALQHCTSLLKCVIGSAGLDKNDPNTLEVMSIITRRTLKAMEVHGSIQAIDALRKGDLISQRAGSGSGDHDDSLEVIQNIATPATATM